MWVYRMSLIVNKKSFNTVRSVVMKIILPIIGIFILLLQACLPTYYPAIYGKRILVANILDGDRNQHSASVEISQEDNLENTSQLNPDPEISMGGNVNYSFSSFQGIGGIGFIGTVYTGKYLVKYLDNYNGWKSFSGLNLMSYFAIRFHIYRLLFAAGPAVSLFDEFGEYSDFRKSAAAAGVIDVNGQGRNYGIMGRVFLHLEYPINTTVSLFTQPNIGLPGLICLPIGFRYGKHSLWYGYPLSCGYQFDF